MMAAIADPTLAPPAPPLSRLGPGILADGNAAGTLSIQSRIEHQERVGLFDEVLGRGWFVLTTASAETCRPGRSRCWIGSAAGCCEAIRPVRRPVRRTMRLWSTWMDGR